MFQLVGQNLHDIDLWTSIAESKKKKDLQAALDELLRLNKGRWPDRKWRIAKEETVQKWNREYAKIPDMSGI